MEFLLEINTEELPAAHVEIALSQLGNKVKDKLEESNVLISGIKTYGTCRRLVVVGDFEAEQKDKEVEIIGPPKTKAFMADCSPSPAAKGFARSQGVSVDELDVIETEKGEYIGVRKVIRGKHTQEILINILPQIISSVSFPKMMRWEESTFKFSRPVKNILCLFDGQVLSF
ncbi:MAG: glycine--tRNA ligase subunit beta, partial [Acidobacteriota bacterium]|nr:glycine--tRNA ligase subunit beta [Acidobacteriota bacterium]